MIVYSREDEFVMVKQHEHGRLAGEFAKQLKEEWLGESEWKHDFLHAVAEHDRSWVDMDEVPLWNDIRNKPYGVEDLPLLLRMPFYLRGLQELGTESVYAGLLVNMHYTSFQPGLMANMVGGMHERALPLLESVKREQIRLQLKLGLLEGESQQVLKQHLSLLQLCDELSLYVCVQEPGTPKEQEKLPYKDGFMSTSSFLNGAKTVPRWLSPDRLELAPSPFRNETAFSFRAKHVSRNRIREVGLAPAYWEASEQEVVFTIC
jgi:hypothetical protein